MKQKQSMVGENWVFICKDDENSEWFVDTANVKEFPNRIFRVKTKISAYSEENVGSVLFQLDFNLSNRESCQ